VLQWLKLVDDRFKSQMISTWKYIKYVWLKIETKSSFIWVKVEDQIFTDITGDFAHHLESNCN
jgi:hypothetical protein